MRLHAPLYRVLTDIQGGLGGPARNSQHAPINALQRLLSIQEGTLIKVGVLVAAYALLEGPEAVGLWLQRRWAEYLTLIATSALLPLEIYELTQRLSPLKIFTLIINLAIVVYLLLAKRLFGIRGGAKAEADERQHDTGWSALERNTPTGLVPAPN